MTITINTINQTEERLNALIARGDWYNATLTQQRLNNQIKLYQQDNESTPQLFKRQAA
jgi:hypothetical protein